MSVLEVAWKMLQRIKGFGKLLEEMLRRIGSVLKITWRRCYAVSKALGSYWGRVVRRILSWRRLDDASKASRKLFDKIMFPRVRSVLKIIWKMLQGIRSIALLRRLWNVDERTRLHAHDPILRTPLPPVPAKTQHLQKLRQSRPRRGDATKKFCV